MSTTKEVSSTTDTDKNVMLLFYNLKIKVEFKNNNLSKSGRNNTCNSYSKQTVCLKFHYFNIEIKSFKIETKVKGVFFICINL